jgi:predicted GH43/DUF377 family glycosyl hydrolase
LVLTKTALAFESLGVLNPAVIKKADHVYLLYRALQPDNPSTIGFCKMNGALTVSERHTSPLLLPELDIESHGLEDPRIVKIDNLYYLTYTAFDGVNAMGALATSTNLIDFKRHGLIVPVHPFADFKKLAECSGKLNEKYARYAHDHLLIKQGKKVLLWDKDVVFFPRRINNKLYFLHRIKPDIQIAAIDELSDLTPEFWDNYLLHFQKNILLTPKFDHEVSYMGGGCPPIETPQGWLVIYHGVHDSLKGYVYSACAALLDLENPHREIARLPYALFKPELDWELNGLVNRICFPTGTALFDDTLYIYYGAADESIACASVSLNALVNELLRYRNDQ